MVEDYDSLNNSSSRISKIKRKIYFKYVLKYIDGVFPISKLIKEEVIKVNKNLPFLELPIFTNFENFNETIAVDESNYFLFCGAANYFDTIKFIIDSYLVSSLESSLILVINGNKKAISRVSVYLKNINSKNINEVLNNNVDFDIDIFSIDIDGLDYWVLNQIKPKISKVIILEYNSIFGSEKELTIPNIENFDRTKAHYSNLYYGASLKSYVSLMNKKGYYLLGVNRLRNNAFFVNQDFPKTKYFQNINTMSLAESTKFNFSESRDIKGNLNYLNNKKKIEEIHNCEVINLQIDKTSLYKIKDVI